MICIPLIRRASWTIAMPLPAQRAVDRHGRRRRWLARAHRVICTGPTTFRVEAALPYPRVIWRRINLVRLLKHAISRKRKDPK